MKKEPVSLKRYSRHLQGNGINLQRLQFIPMLEQFIHTPIYCCILGGLTVPLVQHLEILEGRTFMIQPRLSLLSVFCSFFMYSSMGAITGYVLFEEYHLNQKVTYFYTGLSAPFLFNRWIYIRRESLSKCKKRRKKTGLTVVT